jgi:hypothetical protein
MLVGALLLVAAGAMKLRAPEAAARAARTLGISAASAQLVRLFATVEVALGVACAVNPIRPLAAAVGVTYTAFAVIAALLARQQAACGCFGEDHTPASSAQSAFSVALAAMAFAAAIWGAHGLPYVLGQSPLEAAATLIGLCGAVYALALAYTELPRAWSAWSPQ